MSDKLSALARLAREIREVVPGTKAVSVGLETVTVQVSEEYTVRACAAVFLGDLRERNFGGATWLGCDIDLDGERITILGPDREPKVDQPAEVTP